MKLRSFFAILCLSLFMISCGGDDTEKFIGTWSGEINCEGDVDSVSLVITAGATDDEVILNVEESTPIKAIVDGDNITLETVTEDEGEGDYTEIGGTGSVNSDGQLILNFVLEGFEDGVLVGGGTCIATLSQ